MFCGRYEHSTPTKIKMKELYVFRWNRRYPSDLQLGFNPLEHNMILTKIDEFQGRSHEKITLEVWAKDDI